jgi:hypothetical protein
MFDRVFFFLKIILMDQNMLEVEHCICILCISIMWICLLFQYSLFLFYCSLLYHVCRCVQDDQRSFALGIQWIKVRLIGTIPAPMVFGALIDETCILWQESCHEENGACLVYDNQFMGRWVFPFRTVSGEICIHWLIHYVGLSNFTDNKKYDNICLINY